MKEIELKFTYKKIGHEVGIQWTPGSYMIL